MPPGLDDLSAAMVVAMSDGAPDCNRDAYAWSSWAQQLGWSRTELREQQQQQPVGSCTQPLAIVKQLVTVWSNLPGARPRVAIVGDPAQEDSVQQAYAQHASVFGVQLVAESDLAKAHLHARIILCATLASLLPQLEEGAAPAQWHWAGVRFAIILCSKRFDSREQAMQLAAVQRLQALGGWFIPAVPRQVEDVSASASIVLGACFAQAQIRLPAPLPVRRLYCYRWRQQRRGMLSGRSSAPLCDMRQSRFFVVISLLTAFLALALGAFI